MQILITTSRSISQDRFYQRQQQKRFKIHMQKIQNISSHRLQPLEIKRKSGHYQQLRKTKSAAKLFRQEEAKSAMKKQNKILLSKLINVQPTITNLKKYNFSNQKKYSTTSSNWNLKKKEEEKIKQQNKKLSKKFEMLSTANVKDVKKKLQQEIKQYLQLKNHIRKIKNNKQGRQSSCKSERYKSERKIKLDLPLLPERQEVKQKEQKQQNKYEQNIQKTSNIVSKIDANKNKENNQTNVKQTNQ